MNLLSDPQEPVLSRLQRDRALAAPLPSWPWHIHPGWSVLSERIAAPVSPPPEITPERVCAIIVGTGASEG